MKKRILKFSLATLLLLCLNLVRTPVIHALQTTLDEIIQEELTLLPKDTKLFINEDEDIVAYILMDDSIILVYADHEMAEDLWKESDTIHFIEADDLVLAEGEKEWKLPIEGKALVHLTDIKYELKEYTIHKPDEEDEEKESIIPHYYLQVLDKEGKEIEALKFYTNDHYEKLIDIDGNLYEVK